MIRSFGYDATNQICVLSDRTINTDPYYQSPVKYFKKEVDNALNYDQLKALAESKGGRLPTYEEGIQIWKQNNDLALFQGDQWAPITHPDKPSVKDYQVFGTDARPGYSMVLDQLEYQAWGDSTSAQPTRGNLIVINNYPNDFEVVTGLVSNSW